MELHIQFFLSLFSNSRAFFWSDGKKIMDISQEGGVVVCCLFLLRLLKESWL